MKTITIIDTFGFFFRSYYALPPLRNSDGFPTGLLTGFVNLIEMLQKEHMSDYIVFALDSKGDTFRNELYPEYKANRSPAPKTLEAQISELMQDEDVSSKKGVYEYLLTGKEKHLNIRAFTGKMKREAYEKQKGICVVCKEHFELSVMEADHITPWHDGGKTDAKNCQMLCRESNRRKSGK